MRALPPAPARPSPPDRPARTVGAVPNERALPRPLALATLVTLAGASLGVAAQVVEETQREQRPPRAWDGTLGFVVSHGPPYAGSARRSTAITPGLGLRWGRFSLVSRSAFSVRGTDAAAGGGLRVELADGERLRVGLGLRTDSGRQASDSSELRGLGDVRRTLRLRLSVSYRLDDGWRLRANALADALGRGTGLLGDLQLSRDLMLATNLNANATLSLGFSDRRHMQAYYGITPEQAQNSGYAESRAAAGLRDVSLNLGLRRGLSSHWALFGGAGVSRLVGPAARSPIAFERTSWGLNAGLVYRF
jgi:outer membrane scaffolding protein for murein synthesis (MipA/OmpV family)